MGDLINYLAEHGPSGLLAGLLILQWWFAHQRSKEQSRDLKDLIEGHQRVLGELGDGHRADMSAQRERMAQLAERISKPPE